MQKICFSIAFLLLSLVSIGQEDSIEHFQPGKIKLVARYKSGAVELRWYPTSSAQWRIANKQGYVIERIDLNADGSKFEKIATVKPYTSAEFNSKTDMQDDFIRATKEAIESTPKMPTNANDFDKMAEYQNDENGIFLTFIMSTNMNVTAAEAAGLHYTDKTITQGKEYAYRIYINAKDVKEEDMVMMIVSNTKTEKKSFIPEGLRAEENEGAVNLFWNYNVNRRNFTAYFIERSADGGRTYQPLNKTPLIFTVKGADEVSYVDSVKNYTPYTYRVSGLTAFGDKSDVSLAVTAMGRDKTPAAPASEIRADGDRNKIIVAWQLPNPAKDLAGFFVGRSTSMNGPFHILNAKMTTKDTRTFVDEHPLPKEPYYMLYTLDTANNVSSTYSIMASVYDSTAPAQPMALEGAIDSNGVVRLKWKYGSDNDLHGYHVFVANGKDNVYRQLTGYPLNDSVYIDTVNIKTLTKEVYYKITAVDYNNNPSPYSAIATLKRPDIIAPSAPLISSYTIEGNKVSLQWEPSSSDDVVKHELQRTDASGKKITLTSFTTATNNKYVDSTVTEGAAYTYELAAIDESGLRSASTLDIAVAETSAKAGVERVEAKWDDKDKEVVLNWQYKQKGDYSFVVFRGAQDGDMRPLRTLEGSTTTFTDNNVNSGKYQYAIKVLYNNGAESKVSKPVAVEVKL